MPGTKFFVSNACKWGAQSRFKMSATTVNLFSPENSSMIQWRLFYPGLIHISRIARLCAGRLMDGFPYIKRGIGGFSFDGARWDVSLFRTAQKEILSSDFITVRIICLKIFKYVFNLLLFIHPLLFMMNQLNVRGGRGFWRGSVDCYGGGGKGRRNNNYGMIIILYDHNNNNHNF